MHSRSFILGATLGLLITTLLLAPTGAAADPAHSVAEPGAVADDNPEQLLPFSADAVDLVEFKQWLVDNLGDKSNQYVESVNDASSRAVTILWAGGDELPSYITDEARKRHIEVRQSSRIHSRSTLEDAALAVMAKHVAFEEAGLEIFAVAAVNSDFDGIMILGSPIGGKPAQSEETWSKMASAVAGVPVRLNTKGEIGATVNATSRQNDSWPFNGGALLSDGSDIGSTGFANSVGAAAFTTWCNHCNIPSSSNGTGGVYALQWTDQFSPNGTQQNITKSPGTGQIFSYTPTSSLTAPIVGYANVSVGDQICTSGGNSGLHCGLTVENTDFLYYDPQGIGQFDIYATASSGIASMQGDSGGPAFMAATASTALAVGHIQAGYNFSGPAYTGAQCAPANSISTNKCYPAAVLDKVKATIDAARAGAPTSLTVAAVQYGRSRSSSGTWSSMAAIPTNVYQQSIAAATTPNGVTHLVSVASNGRQYHQTRTAAGSYSTQTSTDIQGARQRVTGSAIAATLDNYVQIISLVDGREYHQTRDASGGWSVQFAVPYTVAPKIVSVSGAGMPNGDTQWVSIDENGNAYHQIRFYSGGWTQMLPLSGVGAGSGNTASAAAATLDNYLQIVLVRGNGVQYHQMREPAGGTWTGPAQIPGSSTDTSTIAGAGMSNGDAQFISVDQYGNEYHQIRYYSSSWSGYNPTGFNRISGAAVAGDSNAKTGDSWKLVSRIADLVANHALP